MDTAEFQSLTGFADRLERVVIAIAECRSCRGDGQRNLLSRDAIDDSLPDSGVGATVRWQPSRPLTVRST
jgi:hypothetical protein